MNKNNVKKYRKVEKKGEGTFSEVFKAQHIRERSFYAIKCMKEKYNSIQEVNNLKEIEVLRKLNSHPNIINLKEVLFDSKNGQLAIVFELMDKNLYDIISSRRLKGDIHLDSRIITRLAFQLFTALKYIHDRSIFHRDVKPENILVNSSAKILKLADFGSCQGSDVKQPITGYIATRWYRAPENLLTDGHYGPAMDIWGGGSVLYELTSLYPLFSGSNEVDQLNRIHRVLGTPSPAILAKFKLKSPYHKNFNFPIKKGVGIKHFIPNASLNCMKFISSALEYDFTKRITASQALSHPYFATIQNRGSLLENYSKLKTRIRKAVSSKSVRPNDTSNMKSSSLHNQRIRKKGPTAIKGVAHMKTSSTDTMTSIENSISHMKRKSMKGGGAVEHEYTNTADHPSKGVVSPPVKTDMQEIRKITIKLSKQDSNASSSFKQSKARTKIDTISNGRGRQVKAEPKKKSPGANEKRQIKKSPVKNRIKKEETTQTKDILKKVSPSGINALSHKPVEVMATKVANESRIQRTGGHAKVRKLQPVAGLKEGQVSKVGAGNSKKRDNIAKTKAKEVLQKRTGRYSNVSSSGYGSSRYSPQRGNNYVPGYVFVCSGLR